MKVSPEQEINLTNSLNITQYEYIPTQDEVPSTLNDTTDSINTDMSVITEKSNSYLVEDDDLMYEDEFLDALEKIEEKIEKNQLGFTQIVESLSSTQLQNIERTSNLTPNTPELFQTSPSQTPIISPIENDDLEFWFGKWGLPKEIIELYQSKGIKSLFPWQIECLNQKQVLYGGENLVYCAPTSGGKTLVSEILMIRRVFKKQKKALYVLPYISIVEEKVASLKEVFQVIGIETGVSGHFDNKGGYFEEESIAVCTIEKSNLIINRLIEEGKLDELCIIVIDELHMMSEKERGYILEMILSKVIYMKKEIQIISMSATIPNVEVIANWLDAFSFYTNYRPVSLKEYYRKTVNKEDYIYDKDKKMIKQLIRPNFILLREEDPNYVFTCTYETIQEGNSVLIFCNSRDECHNTSKRIYELIIRSKNLSIIKRNEKERKKLVQSLKNLNCKDSILLDGVLKGVGVHHAGLTINEKSLIEKAYRDGVINVLTCTTTLAAGVNLPSRRVLFNGIKMGTMKLTFIQYKQASGRAGRKGKDILGESIILSSHLEEQNYAERLIHSKPEYLYSTFKDTSLLGRAILEMISSKACQKIEDVFEFSKCTFFSKQNGFEKIKDHIIKTVEELKKLTLVESLRDQRLVVSKSGIACSSSLLLPSDAKIIIMNLESLASKGIYFDTDLQFLFFTVLDQQRLRIDWKIYQKIVKYEIDHSKREKTEKVAKSLDIDLELLTVDDANIFRDQNDKMTNRLSKFFAALILEEIIHEIDLTIISEKYKISKGIIQSLQKNASVFSGYLSIFCSKLGWWNYELCFFKLAERLDYGVKTDILELLKIPSISKLRARELYKAALTSIISVSESSEEEIYQIISKVTSWSDESKDTVTENDRILARKIFEEAKYLLKEKNLSPNFTQFSQNVTQSVRPILGSPGKRKMEISPQPLFKQPKSNEKSMIKKVIEEIIDTNIGIQIIKKEPKEILKMIEKLEMFSFGIQYEEISPPGLEEKNQIKLIGCSICYYDINKDIICFYFELNDHSNQEILQKILNLKNIKIGMSIQKQLKSLIENKFNISETFYDPFIAQWMLAPEDEKTTVQTVLEKYCPNSKIKGKAKNKIEEICQLTAQSLELMNRLIPLLESSKQFEPFIKVEMKLVVVLAQMEVNGMGFDDNEFKKLNEAVKNKLKALEKTAHKIANKEFSITSTKELSNILFVDLKLPPQSKTGKGNVSTNKNDLEKLKNLHPIIDVIIEHRKLSTMLSKYIKPLPKFKRKYLNGYRVYPSIEHTNTATGRLAYDKPNLQNIPKPREFMDLDKEEIISIEMRKAFVSSNGCFLISADYKQIEFRLLAHCTEDEKLISIFIENSITGKDIFKQLSVDLLGKSEIDITNEEREKAKRIIYAINYSMGIKTLSQISNMSYDEAEQYIHNFYKKFPKVNKYHKESIEKCKKNGYITTIHGRRRYINHINSSDSNIKSSAERQVLNSIMQGSAADLVKVAMINIHNILLNDKNYQEDGIPVAKIVLNIHDELVFEVKEDYLDDICKMIKEQMENAIQLKVPTPISIKVGKNWHELSEI